MTLVLSFAAQLCLTLLCIYFFPHFYYAWSMDSVVLPVTIPVSLLKPWLSVSGESLDLPTFPW